MQRSQDYLSQRDPEVEYDELGFDRESIQSIGRKKSRKFNHKLQSYSGFSAANINNVKTVLTTGQLKQCANAWINNGILRQCLNKLVWHLLPNRTKFLVQPNSELTEFIEREKLSQTIQQILGESENRVPELQIKLIRANKRVELHNKVQSLVKNSLLFGRNFLGVERFPKDEDWPIFGEPRALKPMNSLRIVDVAVDDNTYDFKGFYSDYGTDDMRKVLVKPIDMIPLWNDDDNVLDMTYYSGTSAVWSCITVAQAIDVMNDEDVPEYVKNLYAKVGECYAGTNSKNVIKAITEELNAGSMLVHGRKDLRMTTVDVAGSLMDIMNGREASAKFIAWSMAIPLFIIFEDTANFATANQALQAFKVGTLDRMRTWIQNALEKYWYDPMLADHLNIELEDVLEARIKVKAVIEDIIYDTPTDIANKEVALVQAGIHTVEQALETMGEDKFLEEARIRGAERARVRAEAISEAEDMVRRAGLEPATEQQRDSNEPAATTSEEES